MFMGKSQPHIPAIHEAGKNTQLDLSEYNNLQEPGNLVPIPIQVELFAHDGTQGYVHDSRHT
jgi:hypothetical protein